MWARVLASAAIVLAPSAGARPPPVSTPATEASIQHVLDDSVAGWNSGNLNRFVAPYSDAPDSIISGARDVLHRARSTAIAANQRYFTPEHSDERGRLRYETIEMMQLDPSHMLVLVRFDLQGAGEDHLRFGGVSSMIFVPEGDGWKIVFQADSNLNPTDSDTNPVQPTPVPSTLEPGG